MFCCKLLYVPSSFAIILMGKRELVALSSWCLLVVVWFFLAVPWVCLQLLIVVFPDHTHFAGSLQMDSYISFSEDVLLFNVNAGYADRKKKT